MLINNVVNYVCTIDDKENMVNNCIFLLTD